MTTEKKIDEKDLWLGYSVAQRINTLRRELKDHRERIWKKTNGGTDDSFDYFRCGQMVEIIEAAEDALFDVLNGSAAHYDDKEADRAIRDYR